MPFVELVNMGFISHVHISVVEQQPVALLLVNVRPVTGVPPQLGQHADGLGHRLS